MNGENPQIGASNVNFRRIWFMAAPSDVIKIKKRLVGRSREMRIHLIKVLFLLMLIASVVSVSAKDAPMLVSAQELGKMLGDPKLVLLHVGDKAEFDKAHLPGAQFITLRDISVPSKDGKLNTQLPPAGDLRTTLEKFGISNDSRIVIYYGNNWVSPTTRVYFTLDYLGLAGRASILDGGMKAWIKAGNQTTTEVRTPAPGSLKVVERNELVADANWLKSRLKDPSTAVVDARATEFYDGTSVGFGPRGGHIEGAKSVPFDSLFDENGFFKPDAEVARILNRAGVEKDDTVVSYCHVGQQATVVYFNARRLGYNIRVYDGSFEEWSERFDLPVDDPKKDSRSAVVQFVSPDWVAARVNDANIRILDVRGNAMEYFNGHVPNAVFLPDAALRGPRGGFPLRHLETWMLSEILSNAGVKKQNQVVIYSDAPNATGAGLVAYILEKIGHKQIGIIDGGIEAYKEKFPLAKEFPKYAPEKYEAFENRAISANLDDVKSALAGGKAKFVDARPTEAYAGETNIWIRNGHIPGAISLPWQTLMDSKNPHRMKPLAEIRKVVEAVGLTSDDDIIVYCTSSREASIEYVVLKHILKFPKVRLYEGSWSEYSAMPDLKIETGRMPAEKK